MPPEVHQFGSLTCRTVSRQSTVNAPRLGVVFCHGFGAPGTDLVPLADALVQTAPSLGTDVEFLFPEAPVSLADQGMPGGRAWWLLSVSRLQAQLQSGNFAEIRETNPEGLAEARTALSAAIDAWRETRGLERSQIVLGGFSQGAMISVETAAGWDELPAGLVALSGTLIRESAWRAGLSRKPGLKVFQSHGTYDVVLPYIGGEWLKEVLTEAGANVTFRRFDGGHEIPWTVLTSLVEFLEGLLPNK